MGTLTVSSEIAYTLREIPFFAAMPSTLVARIEEFVEHRSYESRQMVYYPDDLCESVYWVRQGRVKVTRVSGDGRQLTYRHLFAGDILGEECLVGGDSRADYAEVREFTVLSCMQSEIFRQFATEESSFSMALASSLCHRVGEVEQILADTVFKSVRHRVASGLLRLYRRESCHHGSTLRVTHQEISSLAGSTRETTTSVLHTLREEGILKMANRRVTVLDVDALGRLANGSAKLGGR